MKLCKTLLPLTAPLALALLGACASTGSDGGKNSAGAGKDMAMDAAMSKPAPEHANLQSLVGTWDATVTSMMPDGAQTSSAIAVYRAIGKTWLESDFSGTMGGEPFFGHGIDGYDPLKKKFVSTWVDTMSPEMLNLEGTHDTATGTTTMTGKGHDMNGDLVKYRMTSTMQGDNAMTFNMYTTGKDGKEMQLLKIEYKRRK